MPELTRRVRSWLGRPLHEQPPALLAGLVGLLVIGAIVAVAGGGSHEEPRRPATPAPSPVLGRERPPQHGGEAVLDAAQQTAQAFLDEYLPFIYGQGPLPKTSLTPQLRERLRRDYESRRARVPPTQLELRPTVISLGMSGKNPEESLRAEAVIDDGSGTRYAVKMTLEPRAGVWRVTDLG